MARNRTKRTTIVKEHIKRLILAIAVGSLVFAVIYQTTAFFTDRYLEESGYYRNHEEQYVASLQEYVQQENVASDDSDALTRWGRRQNDIFFQIYDNDELIFQYYGRESKSFKEAAQVNFLEWVNPYPLKLADGDFRIIIFGDYYYKAFEYVMIVNVLAAFIAFLIVFLSGIRKRTRYITQLRDEIEILGGGDLDYEVTVKGNDELAELAENLDQMRVALRHHMEEENRLKEERQGIVTQLSHDIRTPLTSMNLFADLLKRGEYEDDVQRDHYLDRIQENAKNLTNLAEELFNVSRNQIQGTMTYNSTNKEIPTDKMEEQDLTRVLADAAEALRLSGFSVQEYYSVKKHELPMEGRAFARVMDNITSNILRYADPMEPVIISLESGETAMTISFENRKCEAEDMIISGAGIGLKNIQSLVHQQGGTVVINDSEDCFSIHLSFPV